MYLRAVEIIGFKSFADRTRLEFQPGITAMVGPNGSGKSNIAEAVRWVLGEQNPRELRGLRMEDVIFSGSAGRKALGLAEVSVTLDNADGFFPIDFSEITITRRVDRSGTSDYYLNQAPARHRDIAALLADTGMGKGTYAFISQGKVDHVLSARPEDRRPVFDEAAGIARFKQQKGEADRLLVRGDGHLLRLNDILSEMLRHLAPLEEEAVRARRYLRVREQLKDRDVQLLSGRAQAAAGRLEERRRANERLTGELERLERELALHQKAREDCRSRLEQVEAEIDGLNAVVLEAARLEERAGGDVARIQANVEALVRQGSGLREELAEIDERRGQWEQGDQEEAGVLRRIRGDMNTARDAIDALEEDMAERDERRSRLAAEFRRLQDEVFQVMSETARLRNEISGVERERELHRRELVRLERERETLLSEKGRLEDRLRAFSEEMKEQEKEIASLKDEVRRLDAVRAEKSSEAEGVGSLIASLRERVAGDRSRLELLRELEQSFDGYARGTGYVLRQRAEGNRSFEGVIGAVADLLKPRAGCETAIEAALGGAVQYLIVEREEDARLAIEDLKKGRTGRATFLPLETIRPARPADRDLNLAEDDGAVGWAASLVDFDPRLKPAVLNLLGRILVARDLEAALALARAGAYRYRVVTMDGDIIHSGGAVSGGSVPGGGGSSGGVISRKSEIQNLSGALTRSEEQLRGHEHQFATLREELTTAQRELTGKRDEIQRRAAEREETRHGEARCEERLGRLNERLREIEAAAADLRHEETPLDDGALEALKDKEGRVEEGRRRLTMVEKELADEDSRREAVSARLAQERIRLAAMEKEEQGRFRWEEGLRARREELDRTTAARRESLENLTRELRQAERALLEAGREADSASAEKHHREEALREARSKREAYNRSWREEDSRCDRLRDSLRRVEGQLRPGEVAETKAAMELRTFLQNLAARYDVEENEALTMTVDLDPSRAEKEVARLRAEIAAMGPVNLRATEEYRREKQRARKLEDAARDLEQAREMLERLAEAAGNRMEQVFEETVREVRQQFQDVFSSLFEGGHADLTLVEREGEPTAGVEVVVQPPGKKLQHLSLLSGGERALSAIALLFALLRVRPAPFCVLDEIDAALDETNVARFGRYLKNEITAEHGAGRQFIIITHQRGTMEASDRLFGVTMEEDGGSRLFSVSLEEKGRTGAA